MSSKLMTIFQSQEISVFRNVRFAIAILAIVIVILLSIIRQRARTYARWLETGALSLLQSNDDGPMLDCTNERLHAHIIQSALRRGNSTLQRSHISSDTELSTLNNNSYYHSYSSSMNSSESNNSSFDKHTEDSSFHKPQQMIQQVGGVSQHKQPVMTLEPCYILKPLRLTHIQKERCKNDLGCYSGAKDGMKDKTKVYRGVREIAFYETLAFASRQLQFIQSCMELMEDNATTNLSLPSIRYILSCHSAIYTPLELAGSDTDDSDNGWSILKRIKEFCICADTWNRLALMIAYQAGVQVVTSSIKSYINTCITLATELESLRKMADFTSRYYGVVDLQRMEECKHLNHPMAATSLSHPHLLLENITGNFRHPNIIDLKMGTQTYEPSAPEAKQLREIQKYTQQAEFGFRIVGMRVYDAATDAYICKDKSFGTSLMTEDEVMGALGMFFSMDGVSSNTCLTSTIDNILRQLTNIQDWFENSNSIWAFYGGSILIVYEGDDGTSNATNTDPAVRMIDFAHVCRKQGGDEGYLKGIKTLLSMLLEIRNSLSITS